MQDEYDFASGQRGKFTRADMQLIPPIRLEPEVLKYLIQLAKEKGTTLNILINQLLNKDIELIAIGA
jgi:predicted HicB family RNase H-like nuclease